MDDTYLPSPQRHRPWCLNININNHIHIAFLSSSSSESHSSHLILKSSASVFRRCFDPLDSDPSFNLHISYHCFGVRVFGQPSNCSRNFRPLLWYAAPAEVILSQSDYLLFPTSVPLCGWECTFQDPVSLCMFPKDKVLWYMAHLPPPSFSIPLETGLSILVQLHFAARSFWTICTPPARCCSRFLMCCTFAREKDEIADLPEASTSPSSADCIPLL
jgi:hypothetical protein